MELPARPISLTSGVWLFFPVLSFASVATDSVLSFTPGFLSSPSKLGEILHTTTQITVDSKHLLRSVSWG